MNVTTQTARTTYGKLLVVEDEDAVFRVLERIVSRFRPVRHASSLESATGELRDRDQWCGFLFDLSLGPQREAGMQLLETVHSEFPGVPAALVTGHIDGSVVNRVAALGATIISKPLGEHELLPFLQRVMARELGLAKNFSERLNGVSRSYKLSPREHELLAWIVAGGTREGYLAFTGMAETTLKTHVKHVLAKSGTSSLAEAVNAALRAAFLNDQASNDFPFSTFQQAARRYD